MLSRRVAIKGLILAGGGLVLFPSYNFKNLFLNNYSSFKISRRQLLLITGLTEVILPTTDTPGAKEVKASHSLLTMVRDCFEKKDQLRFFAGLEAFDIVLKKEIGKDFFKCTLNQKVAFINKLESNKNSSEDIRYFYSTLKEQTVLAYLNSQYYMTTILNYHISPGFFRGCKKIKKQ